jgi:hypothetical protein
MARKQKTEVEKATTPASDRFMGVPELMDGITKLETLYKKTFPDDKKFAISAIRDTVNVIYAKRLESMIADHNHEVELLVAELRKAGVN